MDAGQRDCLELSHNHEEGSVSRESLWWAHQGTEAVIALQSREDALREEQGIEGMSKRK